MYGFGEYCLPFATLTYTTQVTEYLAYSFATFTCTTRVIKYLAHSITLDIHKFAPLCIVVITGGELWRR